MLVFRTRGLRPLFSAGACRFWDGDGGGTPGGDGGSGGATPPASNPPAANPPANPPANPEDALGDAGKEAIRKEREAAKAARDEATAAKRELEELKNAGASDAEKALKAARAEGEKATRTEFESKIRRAEVRSALRAAGLTSDKALDLAANAPELVALAVEDDGSVKGLTEAIAKFAKEYPEMFAKAPAGGGVTRGVQGGDGAPAKPATLAEAVSAHYAKH